MRTAARRCFLLLKATRPLAREQGTFDFDAAAARPAAEPLKWAKTLQVVRGIGHTEGRRAVASHGEYTTLQERVKGRLGYGTLYTPKGGAIKRLGYSLPSMGAAQALAESHHKRVGAQ